MSLFLACAACGLRFQLDSAWRRWWAQGSVTCRRCGTHGPLARMGADQRAEVWEKFQAMKAAQERTETMILSTTKTEWEENQFIRDAMKKAGLPVPTVEHAIRDSVDFLLGCCYIPDEGRGHIVTETWLRQRGLQALSQEAINWGDLSCRKVKQYADGGWEVYIEEASPDCPALSAYIANWLEKWGWEPVRVVTEW